MMPEASGIDVCRELRARQRGFCQSLCLALVAKGDRALGLDTGADDYIPNRFRRANWYA